MTSLQEVATLQPSEHESPLTALQLQSRLATIQSVMRTVMQDGADYGVIPGTDKPTLYKPGAEKLCVTFRLSADDPSIEQVPEYSGDIRYRVRVPIRTASGVVIAVGVGECSTGEEKYRWRRPVHINEFNAAAEDQKREKWTRSGEVWNQVRVNPADVANTVLKMAHKRAYVHAVIMATAAGAIFTQDIEDLPEGVAQESEPTRAPIAPPQRKSQAATPAAPAGAITVKIKGITTKDGQGDKGPWTKTTVHGVNGQSYGTFDTGLAQLAGEALKSGTDVELTFKESKYGKDIVTLALADRQPGAEG